MSLAITVVEGDRTILESELSRLTPERFIELELAYANFGEGLQVLRRLVKLKQRLVEKRIWYEEGKVNNMKMRQARLQERLGMFEASLQGLQPLALEVKAFVVGELDASDWSTVMRFRSSFWSWAASHLNDTRGPPKCWMQCLRGAMKDASPLQQHIYRFRSGRIVAYPLTYAG